MGSKESLTQAWLRQNVQFYASKDRVFADIDSALSRFPALRPKSDVYTFDDGRSQLLLCVHGLLPIVYRAVPYNIPVNVWLTRDYPRQPPIAYVVPTNDMLVKPGRFTDPSGRCSHDYLQHWERKDEGCNLVSLFETLQDHFSREPPVYAKPPPIAPSSPRQSADQRPPPVPARPGSVLAVSPPKPPPPPPVQYRQVPSAYVQSPTPSQPTYVTQSQAPSTQISSPPPQVPPRPQLSRESPASTGSPAPAANYYPTGPSNFANSHYRDDNPTFSPVPAQVLYTQPQPFATPPPPPLPPPAPVPSSILSAPYVEQGQPSVQSSVHVRQGPPVIAPNPPPVPIPNLLDEDDDTGAPPSLQAHAPFGITSLPTNNPPPRPPNPELLDLHAKVHHKLTSELDSLSKALALDAERLRAHQNDLLAGEPAIRDEMARLEAVRDVCQSVADRTRAAVHQAQSNITELRRKGDPEVDELVCSTSIVHNQLINLVAEDNAIEDTIYHLHRALNTGRIDLERFLRTTRVLAEEQFMKRALINKIQASVPPNARPEW